MSSSEKMQGEGARIPSQLSDHSALPYDGLQSTSYASLRRCLYNHSMQWFWVWLVSPSEVQMRHYFLSGAATDFERSKGTSESDQELFVIIKTVTAGTMSKTRLEPEKVHFLARCRAPQTLANTGVSWSQPQQGKSDVSKSKEHCRGNFCPLSHVQSVTNN